MVSYTAILKPPSEVWAKAIGPAVGPVAKLAGVEVKAP